MQNVLEMDVKGQVPTINNNSHVVLLLCLYVGLLFVSLCTHKISCPTFDKQKPHGQ